MCLTTRLSSALKSSGRENDMYLTHWHWHYILRPGAQDQTSYQRHKNRYTHTLRASVKASDVINELFFVWVCATSHLNHLLASGDRAFIVELFFCYMLALFKNLGTWNWFYYFKSHSPWKPNLFLFITCHCWYAEHNSDWIVDAFTLQTNLEWGTKHEQKEAFPAPRKPFGFWSQTTSQVDLTADLVMGLRRILEEHNWRNSPKPCNIHTIDQVLQCRHKSKWQR